MKKTKVGVVDGGLFCSWEAVNYCVCLLIRCNNVWQLQWWVVLLCLMDLGNGGSWMENMASECNEGEGDGVDKR
jgi:hypothetical protein